MRFAALVIVALVAPFVPAQEFTIIRPQEFTIVRLDPPAPVAPVAPEVSYVWELAPSGRQWGLRGAGHVQLGVWLPGDGYYPLGPGGEWGGKTVPPIAPPARAAERRVGPAPLPFAGWPRASAGETVEADLTAAGPWPTGLDVNLLKGMRRYRRASMTQEIAVTDGRDRITPVHRLGIKSKWHQSGGLEGVSGWRSDLYRSAARPRVFVGNITVKNGLQHYEAGRLVETTQENRGWRREYPDGRRFLDVLSQDGAVFEVRQLEKRGGRWQPRTLFTDEAARPAGYTGLTQACLDCHREAGTGGYATGLVLGGDGILSDPFAALEP